MTTLKTHWSKTSIAVTILVIALMVCIAVFVHDIDRDLRLLSLILMVLIVALCFSAMFFMPTSIRLDGESLTVVFPFRSKRFLWHDIADIKPFPSDKRIWKLCGSGEFFGWWGWFSAKDEGRFMMYASNHAHLLMMTLANGKKYVISCDEPEQLIHAFDSAKH